MVRITEELVRRRAEHNEGEIFSLEEISLHQQDIEKIEHLDKWCKSLKILYLQSNLISKIENVGRLKQLNYLNLALNNIERIENLEGCEFLSKLDLTVNFIGELTSVENLVENYHLKELYLTGNPCTDFEGYRDFVICTLPQLKFLDGEEIKKSDRIKALQKFKSIHAKILESQKKYLELREKQKSDYVKRKNEQKDSNDENFWTEKSEYTPESRIEMHRQQEEMKRKEEEEKAKKGNNEYIEASKPKERRFFSDDGKPYSFNDPKVDYEFNADDDRVITLNVHVFKYMDSSLIDIDVQPTYVRVTLKGKALQLALGEEVKVETSTAQRSQTTGHLLITMEKVNPIIRPDRPGREEKKPEKSIKAEEKKAANYLEVDESIAKNKLDLANIVAENERSARKAVELARKPRDVVKERENSPDFVDDSDVPPLI